MIDWYDLNQCHRPQREAHDYTTGRIFRLGRKGQKLPSGQDLHYTRECWGPADPWALRCELRQWDEKADWVKEQLLKDESISGRKLVAGRLPPNLPTSPQDFRELFRLARYFRQCGVVLDELTQTRPSPLPVNFSVNLMKQALEEGPISAHLMKLFQEWAGKHPSPIVRLALASACQRLTVEQRKPIVLALLAHEEDKDDQNLPLMYWYAAEPVIAADAAWAAEALAVCKIPRVTEFIARRMAEK